MQASWQRIGLGMPVSMLPKSDPYRFVSTSKVACAIARAEPAAKNAPASRVTISSFRMAIATRLWSVK